MKKINDLYLYLSSVLNIDIKYVSLTLNTILCYLIILILKNIIKFIIKLIIKDDRKHYLYVQNSKIILNILYIIMLLFVWENYIKNLITLISFLSAALTFALRDIILNFFCGMYIKFKKIFKIEDRIQIDDIKGDVTNISSLEFSILEINSKQENGQSTGVVVTFPNSVIFSKPIKNYTKLFKYIWDEMVIEVTIDSEVERKKKELYRIINSNEIVKLIPKKMEKQINHTNDDFRIYYNKYEPMIYTKIVDDYIELTIRYLIHPKKARYVNSVIWNNIITSYKDKKIDFLSFGKIFS